MTLLLTNFSKAFGSNLVLDAINLDFPKGSILGVLGHNGAGKSTFIRCLSGQENFAGQASIEAVPITDFLEKRRPDVAIVPDTPSVYGHLSVAEFMRFVIEFKGHDYQSQKAEMEKWVEAFDLRPHLTKLCRDCSFGTQKKAFLIPQLVTNPNFVLLDEPTNGLDVESQYYLRGWLKTLAEAGAIVIVTSHNLDFLGKVASSILLLKRGEKARTILAPDDVDLEALFLGEKL